MEEMQKITTYKSRRWKWMAPLLLILAAAVGGGVWFAASGKGEKTYRFVTRPAETGEINITVSATGYLKPLESVDIGTEISGTITNVPADYNDNVKKGQLLAQMDTTKYQSAVDRADAVLLSAKASQQKAKAELSRARTKAKRDKQLRENTKGALPSRNDWDIDRTAYLSARAEVDNAQAQVDQARHSLVSAQYDLERTSIYSPIDGIVLNRNVDPGQTVAATFQTPVLFTIAKDLRRMELQVSIDEADIAKVSAGQPATFSVDAYPDAVFRAAIRMVRLNSQIEEGVVTYIAVLDVNNSDLRLRPGMSAEAEITVERFDHALIVPRAALLYIPATEKAKKLFDFHRDDASDFDTRPHVWRLKDGHPEKLYVKVLGSSGMRSVIASDTLKEGDALIIAQEKQP